MPGLTSPGDCDLETCNVGNQENSIAIGMLVGNIFTWLILLFFSFDVFGDNIVIGLLAMIVITALGGAAGYFVSRRAH